MDDGLDAAMVTFARGDRLAALRLLESLDGAVAELPRARALRGLLLATERGLVREGVELARAASASAPEDPWLAATLARTQLRAGDKSGAIETLKAGARHHPDHEDIHALFVEIGVRRPLLFKTLPRSHPLNRYLGLLSVRLGLR